MGDMIIPKKTFGSFMLGVMVVLIALFAFGVVTAASVFDAGGGKISNLGTPTANTDAATKAYADAAGSVTWEGYSNVTTGNLGGLKGANELCEANYTGSHWASYDEIMALGDDYPWTYDVWIWDGVVAVYLATNVNWVLRGGDTIAAHTYTPPNCGDWGSANFLYRGPSMNTIGSMAWTACNVNKRLACVS